jgi:hypothetical protein
MSKKLTFMVVDTETATLAFADEIAQGDTDKKKRIAIAKPLVYDIGWTIVDRAGTIHDKKQFLIAETFSVPSVFNTAYYKEKRPIYLEMLKRGETCVKSWNEIMETFISDLRKVNAVGAFNSMFDFKKAIPFTELYIKKLYSPDFYQWEEFQYKICEEIASGNFKVENKREFLPDIFQFRGAEYPLFDLWGLSVSHLLNNATYKTRCLENDLLTDSGTYFKTSAESTYKYLMNKYDFIESHTALDDAIIESFILHKIAQKHAITPGIKYFPFSDLGYTYDFCRRRKNPNIKECEKVINKIREYLDKKEGQGIDNNYIRGLYNRLKELKHYAKIPLE